MQSADRPNPVPRSTTLVSACTNCGELLALPEAYEAGESLVCPDCEKPIEAEEIQPRSLHVALRAKTETEPPARPEPRAPEQGSLDDWLKESAEQVQQDAPDHESVLEPTPSDHDPGTDLEVETSLSGIEIGSIFPPQEDLTNKTSDSGSAAPEEPAPETLTSQTPPDPLRETIDLDADLSAGTATIDDIQESLSEAPHASVVEEPPDDRTIDEEDARFEPAEPSDALEPDPEATTVRYEPASGEHGAEVSVQLLEAGATHERRRSIIGPLVGSTLLLLLLGSGGYAGYLWYLSGQDSGAQPAVALGSEAARADDESAVTDGAAQASDDSAEDVTPASFEAFLAESAGPDEEMDSEVPSGERELVGDRYASATEPEEPSFLDEVDEASRLEPVTPAEPEAAATSEKLTLSGAPVYSYEDLFSATSEARAAGRAFARGTLDDTASAEAMGAHYARLCYLAQVLTLLDPAESNYDLQTAKFEAIDVFKRVFRKTESRDNASTVAGSWLAWSGRPHGGIFFVGVPKVASRKGSVYEYEFEFADRETTVVTEEPIDVRRYINANAKSVGVLGVIVEDAAAFVPGYTGDQQRVIWVRKTLALSEPGAF